MEINKEDLELCIKKLPTTVKQILQDYPNKCIVAGGYIRDTINEDKVSDIDIFFTDPSLVEEILEKYYKKDKIDNSIMKSIMRYIENTKNNKILFNSPNAITVEDEGYNVQLIKKWTLEDVKDILNIFDFIISCAGIWYNGNEWQSIREVGYYSNLKEKKLSYLNPSKETNCLGSILRVIKLRAKGYTIGFNDLSFLLASYYSKLQGLDDSKKIELKLEIHNQLTSNFTDFYGPNGK